MQPRMSFIMCTVILFLISGSSAIISQNDLAFWTLLKEYHEMDLPAQAVAAGNDSAASPPVAVRVARAGQADEEEEEAAASGADAGPGAGAGAQQPPVPDDVAVRLLVQLTSEPVQLRVRCARGCRRVHRPCDLYLAPGSPLRMVCYAKLPECMHYGHTTINCGVYYTKRWPEVIEAVCTLDYHTSDSICASFARAGAGAGAQAGAEAEKPFRLMLESLGVRLWPANASASAGLADVPAPAPRASDERVAWLLAGAALLVVLLGIFLVLRFDLAYWTPCAPTWFTPYEAIEAKPNVNGCGPVNVVGNFPFDSSSPGRIFSIRAGDSMDAATSARSKNYKLVMVIVDGVNNMGFSLPVPSSYVYYDVDNLGMPETQQSNSYASAPPYNYLNPPVFPTGISENSDVLLPSQTVHFTFKDCSPPTARNALQFYQEASCIHASSHTCAFTHNEILPITENPLQETSIQLKNQSKVIITHMSTSTEKALALVSSSHSTASVPEASCVPSSDTFHLATTNNKSLEVTLSQFTSLSKPTAMPCQEVESTLLTSPCPTMTSYQSSKPSQAPSSNNSVHHQQLHSTASQHPVSLAYTTAWVCPVVMSTAYTGSPACPVNSPQSEIASSEMTAPVLTDGYVPHSSYTITSDYPTTIAYPNVNAYFPNGPCPETVVFPALQPYAVSEAYQLTPDGLPSTEYSPVTLAYPSLPVYSQSTVNTRIAGVSPNGTNYQCPDGIVGPTNHVPSPAFYANSYACPENVGYVQDFRGRTDSSLSLPSLQPPYSNTEIGQITPDCPENRPYSETLVRQPFECSTAACNTVGFPTYAVPMNSAPCYPTASTYLVMSECQSSPSVEDYTQNSLCQSTSSNQQAFNNQQALNNRSVMTQHAANQRVCANQQPSVNHRILPHQRHSAPQRHSYQHSFGLQRSMDNQRSLGNTRPLEYHRPTINMRPSFNQRPTQRAATYQPTAFYRPTPVHPPPASLQTAAPCVPTSVSTNQPVIPFRAIVPYGATYQPVAPLHFGSRNHPAFRYHPPAAYQVLAASQTPATNQSASAFPPIVMSQEVSPHQGIVYLNENGCPSEAPCLSESVNQPTYETSGTYNLDATQQQPPSYQTSGFPPAPNYHQADVFHPAPVYQQTHLPQVPGFQQGLANPPAPIYQVASPHQGVPVQPHGLPSEIPGGFVQPFNCHATNYPSASYASTIAACNQNSNQLPAVDNSTSFRTDSSEPQQSFVHQPILGYYGNSACIEMGPYHETSGDPQRSITDMHDQQTGCYPENARDCSITIGTQDICVNQNNSDQPFTGDLRAMPMYQIRSDCNAVPPLPVRVSYPTSADNMETACMGIPGQQPTTYFPSADWENNSTYETTMRPPIPPSQPPWIGTAGPVPPNNQQIYEIIDEGTYSNEMENCNGTERQETSPTYNSSNVLCYDCNPNIQTQTYNVSNENCEFYQQGPEQSAGSGDVQYDTIPQRNLIMGADGCVYQEQPFIYREEQFQGHTTRREMGDGDAHRVQFFERPQYQAQDEPYNASRGEVRTDNRYSVCRTGDHCLNNENVTNARQYCYECNRGVYNNPGRGYMNGFINPFQPGGSCIVRETSHDIAANFSQLALNDPAHIAS